MKISGRAALVLGIAAGYAALIGVFVATKAIDTNEVAIMAACFGGSIAAMTPMLMGKGCKGRACHAKASMPTQRP